MPPRPPTVVTLFSTAALALFLSLGACQAGKSAQQDTTSMTDRPDSASTTIFTFSEASDWYIQNDGVMGGRSKGNVDIADGTMTFDGTLVTRGGGFSSVLTEQPLDVSDYEGVEVYARGNGRSFAFALHDGTRDRGREIWWRAEFTPGEEWAWHKVPFAQMKATAHGEPMRDASLNLSSIATSGFYIIDGVDGPFRLEVQEVWGY